MSLQSEERFRSINREHTDVVVVATSGDEAAGVRLIGGDDAHAGHKVGVSIHAVHCRVAHARTTEPEITEETTGLALFQFHSTTARLLGSSYFMLLDDY